MADKKDKTTETVNPFTFNTDKTGQMDIPSVSKLIDRKKLSDSSKLKKEPAASQKLEAENPAAQAFPTLNAVLETDANTQVFSSKDISIQLEAPQIEPIVEFSGQKSTASTSTSESSSIQLENFQPTESETPVQATPIEVAAPLELNTFTTTSADTPPQPAKENTHSGVIIKSRKAMASLPVLSLWKKSALLSAKDPVAEFLKNVLANDLINSALFLAIEVSDQKTPIFRAKAALENSEPWIGIWTGLEWNPKLIPEVWNVFVKNGFVEFSPPGTMTQLTSSRNVIRGAFGLGKTGYLTLVRVGSAQACRGVLALVSDNSIQMSIDPFMSIAKS